ncbi:MAG: thioredoxin family protein [Balneolales bacterium]
MTTQFKLYTAALSLILLTVVLAFILFPHKAQTEVLKSNNSDVNLIAVSLYADWCGSCKQLDAMMDDIKPEFEDGDILFIYLDKTTDFDVKQSQKKARLLGFESVSNQYEGRTGLMLLIDPNTGELVKEITVAMTSDEIKETLRKYSTI